MTKGMVLVLIAALHTSAAVAYKTVEEIETCMNGNIPQRTVRQDIMIRHFDRLKVERTLVGRLYVERGAGAALRMMLALQQPAELRGASYLFLDGGRDGSDSIHVYLPAVKKSRRVEGDAVSSQLFGTNFDYQDLQHLFKGLNTKLAKLLPDSGVAGRPAYTLEVKAPSASAYGRVMVNVDTKTCLTLQAEFFSRGGAPVKRLSMNPDKVAQVDGRFVAHEFRMQDSATAEHTLIYLGDVHYDQSLSANLFHPDSYFLQKP